MHRYAHIRFRRIAAAALLATVGAGLLVVGPAHAASITYETAQPIRFAEGVESPVPNSKVNALSCTSAGNCVAVGYFRNASGAQQAFTVTSTNGVWGLARPLEFPDGLQNATQQFSELSDIDCPSAGNCTAVGTVLPKGDAPVAIRAFSVTLANGEWGTPVAVTFTVGTAREDYTTRFYAVSCASAGNCAAVGSFFDTNRMGQALIQTSENGQWGDGQQVLFDDGVQLPNEFGGTYLRDVDCSEPGFCSAAGTVWSPRGAREAFTVSSNAGVWDKGRTATFPAGTYNKFEDEFNAISCASAGNCTATGYINSSGSRGGTPISQSSTKGEWADAVLAAFPNEVEGESPRGEYTAVSCSGPGNCTAVGIFRNVSLDYGDAEEFPFSRSMVNGEWKAVQLAKFVGGLTFVDSARFNDVSCSSPGNCTAAGFYDGFQEGYTGTAAGFTQTMTNGVWGNSVVLLLPPGTRLNGAAGLTAISCRSAGNCMSGGYYVGFNPDDMSMAAQVDPTAGSPTAGFTQRMTSRPSVLPPSGTNPTPSIAVALVLLAMGAMLLRQRRPTA